MKTVCFFLAAIALFAFSFSSLAQTSAKTSVKTETFKAKGSCEMCKERIEAALKVEGVTKATWDQKTKLVTVTYQPSRVTLDDLQKKVAAVGHDTDKAKADDKVYNKLPGCCKYR